MLQQLLVDGVKTEYFDTVINVFTIKSFATNIIIKISKKSFYVYNTVRVTD